MSSIIRSSPRISPRQIYDSAVELCLRRGYIYIGSEIYGGLSSQYDYGPIGTMLKNNIRSQWWNSFIARRDCVPIESSIIMNRKVWEVAGHVDNFTDPFTECRQCQTRYRVDHLLESLGWNLPSNAQSSDHLQLYSQALSELHPNCKDKLCSGTLTVPKYFNMLFETSSSCSQDQKVYLRPETAQGAYINFHNVLRSTRRSVPFGIGQIGKSFRNEISPGQFIFRTKEFEQAELQWFCKPDTADHWHSYWIDYSMNWLIDHGLNPQLLRQHRHQQLAHYSKATTDIEFRFGFSDNDDGGWGEIWGISNRGDYDLTVHSSASGRSMACSTTGQDQDKFLPYIIEPALGIDRLFLAVIVNGFSEEIVHGRRRVFLRLDPRLSPYEIAVFPVVGKSTDLVRKAEELFDVLARENRRVDFDDKGSIGRRYRRHDEIGTPLCATIDSQTLVDNTVALRCRDTMQQRRVSIEGLAHRSTCNGILDYNEIDN
uniref:glycine--tRNA ligase n=1 Tax=Spongospora subterranea TaxID=70186 RepID=A0A0H5QYT3_9EUKA|eukprot:CRZ07148.1 hypothetical protein [Spongospora subterranea]